MTPSILFAILFGQASLDASSGSTAPGTAAQTLVQTSFIQNVAPILAFIGVVIIVLAIGQLFFLRKKKSDLEQENERGAFGSATNALASVIPESDKEKQDFDLMLRQAGFYKSTDRSSIYAMRFVLLILPVMLGALAAALFPQGIDFPVHLGIINQDVDMNNGLWFVLLGGIVGFFLMIIPRLYVYFRQRSRLNAIRRGLPDTIDMMGMCASGGMNTSDSLEHVASQLREYPDLAQELQILRRQADVGSLEGALKDLNQRVNIPEMRQLTQVLLRGNRSGSKVAGTLNEQADHLRIMRKQSALEQANKMPTKLVFPIMFCFAPAALILLLGPSIMEFNEFITEGTEAFSNTAEIRMTEGEPTPPAVPPVVTYR